VTVSSTEHRDGRATCETDLRVAAYASVAMSGMSSPALDRAQTNAAVPPAGGRPRRAPAERAR